MDIHVNDLVIEDGFKDVPLNSLSFRDIDQEFIFVRTTDSFDSEACNMLYYCFIKPYEGIFFRKIGETDENSNKIYVDEANADIVDEPYENMSYKTISKIVENGDLISNQLLENIPFDYYESNEELEKLMETRKVKWIDPNREKGNPDYVDISGERYKLLRVGDNSLIASTDAGKEVRISVDLGVYEKEK